MPVHNPAPPSLSPSDPVSPSAAVAAAVSVDGADEATVAIVHRFFEVLDLLKQRRTIRGKKTFCDRYGINRWNMNTCQSHPDSGMFKLSWLTYLARDYGVSPDWLLLGHGDPLPPLEGAALEKAELYRRRKATRSSFRSSPEGAKNRPKTAMKLQGEKHDFINQ